ncbi:OsmC family protein [Pontibacterium granulatum]|uniref:OsmC family protein n=1 Tax=Pontibacterium granulatum TaxID=2036029 RepID=UPI00249C8E12|nr:OsmC family protein [Pontibacterium granulatum]MDI3323005.1 OsmC family protein [Pontibacterium granulatum]
MSALKTLSVTANMAGSAAVYADIRDHKVVIDQPVNAGGSNEGPTPLEYFLFSLAGCIASIARIAAMQQKIEFRGMELKVDATLNPAGLLGKDTDDRVGFQTISVGASIDADLSEEEKKAFLDAVCDRCPLHDNIKLETHVDHLLV